MTEQTPHIAVAIPCYDRPHIMTVFSFGRMMYTLGSHRAPMVTVTGSASIVTTARNNCIEAIESIEAKGTPVEWIFWLDDDMVFPHDTLIRLLRHNKDIVGATYCRRSPPYDVHGKTLAAAENGMPLNVDTGLVEMVGMPTGILLTRRDIFKKLPKPWWRLGIDEAKQQQIGEDYMFSKMARDLGYQLWLDVDLSKEIGHVAEKVIYTEEDGWGGKEAQAEIEKRIVAPPVPKVLIPNVHEQRMINGA